MTLAESNDDTVSTEPGAPHVHPHIRQKRNMHTSPLRLHPRRTRASRPKGEKGKRIDLPDPDRDRQPEPDVDTNTDKDTDTDRPAEQRRAAMGASSTDSADERPSRAARRGGPRRPVRRQEMQGCTGATRGDSTCGQVAATSAASPCGPRASSCDAAVQALFPVRESDAVRTTSQSAHARAP